MKKRFTNKILFLVIIQLFLLISFPISNSYFLGKLFNEIGIVSAQSSTSTVCCPETKSGALCQDIDSPDECKTNTISTSCESTDTCKSGCCYDSTLGTCSENSPKKTCETEGGEWDETCSNPKCEKGCCILGDKVDFTTEKTCERESNLLGLEKNFDSTISVETQCLILGLGIVEGACIFDNEVCRRETQSECVSKGGDFYEGYLCSASELNTNCSKQDSISCVEGKNEVYWIDSCGNVENIYSSDKNASWNNGKILPKTQSCNYTQSNIDSKDCGNCKILSSKCMATEHGKGLEEGDFICGDTRCEDKKGNIWKNGESWCEYDGYIGDGKDTVGSRHWRRLCVDGKIKTEPCSDYRNQLCAQTKIEDFGENISYSQCIPNNAMDCISYNNNKDKKEVEKSCNENPLCIYKNTDIDSHFRFSTCVPRYPPGADLSADNRVDYCRMATASCTYVEKKSPLFKWVCKDNCDCKKGVFTQRMNDLCISLGDCGSYVNYIGSGTNSYRVRGGAPGISWKDYTKYSKEVEGQNVDLEGVIKYILTISFGAYIPKQISKDIQKAGLISGGLSSIAGGLELFKVATNVMGRISVVTAGFSIGLTLSQIFGFNKTWTIITSTILGAMGLVLTFSMSIPGVNIIALIITAVLIVIQQAGKVGSIRTKKVQFICKSWEPPIGGKDCHLCNEDPSKPCSEYRCESLGTACKLINENTENPICESIPNDHKAPIISLGDIKEGYNFVEIGPKRIKIEKQGSDKCITEFTPVNFSLKTDEVAECRYQLYNRTNNFDDMTGDFEQDSLLKIHNLTLFMPSIRSLGNEVIMKNALEKYGNVTMYVRCRDYFGNSNFEEYAIRFCINSGPDLTPVNHLLTTFNPQSGSYLEFGKKEKNISMYINEPAECRYSFEPDKKYRNMKNQIDCETDLEKRGLRGWECKAELKGLIKDENKIYIKCLDQPWFKGTVNESQRNENSDDFVYNLYSSESKLKIDSIKPAKGEKVKRGFEPIDVELEVKTSGGSENGKAACFWGVEKQGTKDPMADTNSDNHSQLLANWFRGKYNVYVKCKDSGGNIAEDSTEFEIEIDNKAPEITRIFKDNSGNLQIITNENSKCYYDFKSCNFGNNESKKMEVGFSNFHKVEWNPGLTYYIKCTDVWDNHKAECSVIKPGDF